MDLSHQQNLLQLVHQLILMKKKYSPPKIDNDEPKKSSIKSVKIKKEKKKTVEPLILEKNDGPKVFDEQPLVLNEEPLVLDTAHTEKVEEKNKNIVSTDLRVSPAARKIALKKKLISNQLKEVEKNGIVLKEDVMSPDGVKPAPSERKIAHGPEERIKMTRLRLTIAKRLKDAQENAAMLTTFNEVNMREVIQMRNDYKEDFQNKYSVKLGFMSFFVKACIIGLKNYPAINAEIQGDEIVYKNYYNISIAVGTDKGLVVPVVKNSDELSFAEIEKNINALAQKSQRWKNYDRGSYKVAPLQLLMVVYMDQCYPLQF